MKAMAKIGAISAVAMLLATPAYAAKQSISDHALDGIVGKGDNVSTITGNSSLIGEMGHGGSDGGSVQVGYYQWSDDHSTDGSDHKGANDQSGAHSNVQAHIDAVENTLAWGGASQAVTVNTASIGGDQVVQSWWTMYLGGF